MSRILLGKESQIKFDDPQPEYTITLQFQDENNNRIENAQVIVGGEDLTTDPFGEVTIDLSDGSYSYRINKDSQNLGLNGIFTVSGVSETIIIQLSLVSFTTQDSVTTNDISGADVEIMVGVDETLTTNVNGVTPQTYIVRGAEYTHIATATNYIPLERFFTVSSGSEVIPLQLIQSVPTIVGDGWLWYDAYQMNLKDGTRVSRLDEYFRNWPVVNSNSDTQPVYLVNPPAIQTNGKRSIRFESSRTDRLVSSINSTQNSNWEYFLVAYIDQMPISDFTKRQILFHSSSTSTNWESADIGVSSSTNDEIWAADSLIGLSSNGEHQILNVRFQNNVSTELEGQSIYSSGSKTDTHPTGGNIISSIRFGGRSTGQSNPATYNSFYLQEYIMFTKKLSSTERSDVISYLRNKWGI